MIRRRVAPFYEAGGDKILRQEYDLNDNSIVLDVGGYEGQWASDIFSRYCCYIHIFEPVPSFFKTIKKRFIRNPKIFIYNEGLFSVTTKKIININESASSLMKTGNISAEVSLIDVKDFFIKNDIEKVDLMKINIEGAEYDLLDRMIETNLIKRVVNLQVQFHNFYPHAEKRMRKIQKELEKTHKLTYQFLFVWENWLLK